MAEKVTQEVEFKAKADGAISTIKELKKAIQEAVKGLEGNVKLNLDSKNFDKGLDRAKKKLDGLSKDIKLNVDNKSALTRISEVKKALDGIKAKKLNIGVGNASKAADRVTKISNALNKLNKDTVVDVKSSGLADVENRVKNVAKQLDQVDKNLGIKVSLDDGGTLSTLTKIRDALIDIKKNNNINIKTTASSNTLRQRDGSNVSARSRGGIRRRARKSHEVDDLLRTDQEERVAPGYAKTSANAIYSIGRASKGFGSALEVAAYQLGELAKNAGAGGASGAVGTLAARILPGIAVVTGVFAAFSTLINVTTALGNALGRVAEIIYRVLEPGIDLYVSKTKATYGMAAAIKSQGYIGGQRFEDAYGANATNTSIALSRKLLNKAMLDAEKSVFDFSEIIESLQGTLPMLMSRGMSLDQAYEVNKGVAAVAKTLQLAPNQVLQEMRDIAQNSITSRSSQVANALHITNEELKQFGDDVDKRFDYLMKKFANYREMLEEYSTTPVGAFERMKDRLLKVSSDIVEKMAPMFMGLFNMITDATGRWEDQNKNIFDTVTNTWKQAGQSFGIDAEGNKVEGGLKTNEEVGEAQFIPSEIIDKLQKALPEIIKMVGELIDGFVDFIETLTDTDDPIDAIISLLKSAITIFFDLARAAAWVGDIIVGAFSLMEAPIMWVIRQLQLMGARFKVLTSMVKTFGASVAYALLSAVDKLPDGVKEFFGINGDGVHSAMEGAREYLGEKVDETKNALEWENKVNMKAYGFDNGLSFDAYMKERYGAGSKFGAVSQALEKGVNAVEEMLRKQQEGVENDDLKSVKGNPNPGADDKNAQKKAIQESQQAMKAHIDGLRDALKEHIEKLKDTLEKNKIAFDEGFMSIKDYYTQKAEIEKQEATYKLQEAMEELAVIQQTSFANDYERIKAENDAKRQIREYTRQVEKAGIAIGEVARAWENNMNSLSDFTRYMNTQGRSASSQPFSVGSTNEETAYRFLTSQGYSDAIATGIVAAMKGESLGNPRDEHTDSNGLLSMGIAQWNGARRDALLEFGRQNNSDPYDILTQLAFLVQELNTTEKEALNRALAYYNENGQTAEAMAYAFTKFVERPADQEGQGRLRASYVGDVRDAITKGTKISTENIMGDYFGLDSRYMDFSHYLHDKNNADGGFNLKPEARQLLNMVARDYFNETGEKLGINVLAGGSHLDNSEWGHNAGWKADLWWETNMEKLAAILDKYGAAAGHEDAGGDNDHYDVSFGKGHVGGTVITKKPTGTGTIPGNYFVQGGSYQSFANTTATGSEANKKMEEAIKEGVQRSVEAQALILDVYNKDLGAGIAAKRLQIAEKNRKLAKNIELNFPEGEERDKQIQALITNMNGELNDLETQMMEKRLDYNVKASKTWGKYAGYETFKGSPGSMGVEEFIRKYSGYFYDDVDNPLAPAFILENMWKKVKDYESLGSVDKAQDLRQKILDTYGNLNSIFDEYLTQINGYFSNYSKWADSAGMTKLQREKAGLEIESAENRLKAEVLGEQVTKNEGVLQRYQDELTRVNEELAKYIALEREANKVGDTEKAESSRQKVAYYKSEADRLKLSRQQLAIRTDQLRQEKLIAENMSKNDNMLKRTRDVAKQALEDGLVKFLTDGVNEAKSLGDALRDLFTGILKEMQQFFAKQLVTSIMNGINPMMRQSNGYDNYGRPLDDFARTSGYPGIGQRGVYQPNPQMVNMLNPSPTIMQKPWEKQGAFDVDLLGKKDYKASAMNSLTEFGSKVDTATMSLTDFGLGTNVAKEAVDSLANATQEGATQGAVTQITTAGTEVGTAIQTAGTSVVTALNTVAAQIRAQSIGSMGGSKFATGGLVSGIGTGTSDSIPAMLSNGEFVIRSGITKKLGTNFLNAINSGNFSKIRARLPHFADGGAVGDIQGDTARGMEAFANSIGTNVSTVNNINLALVRDEDEAMGHFMRSPDGQRIMLDFNRRNAHITSQF